MARLPVPTGVFAEAEIALSRIGAYLSACGINLDHDTSVAVLALVQEGIQLHADDLNDWLITAIQNRFIPKPQVLPAATPPLLRTSICYARHL